MNRVAMIVPAAGLSSRYPPNKLLIEIESVPAIVRTLTLYHDLNVDLFTVVGHQSTEIRGTVEKAGLTGILFVENPEYASGMASSMKAGLVAAGDAYDYYGISLADKPFIQQSTVRMLLTVLAEKTPLILAPSYESHAGHPIFFHRSCLDELLEAQGETGGRDVREMHRDQSELIAVKDEGVVLDLDAYLGRNRG